jgi:hypothetical protein
MQEADFQELADEFINMANELNEDWATPFLSAAFLYAAARFNAFNFHQSDGVPENAPDAVEYYTGQYRKMLEEAIGQLAD